MYIDGMLVRQDRHLQAIDPHDKVQIFIGEFQKQAGPIVKTLERHPDKSLVVAFPPARRSRTLEAAANGHFEISRDLLRDNQLPDTLHAPNGFILRRPDSWQ